MKTINLNKINENLADETLSELNSLMNEFKTVGNAIESLEVVNTLGNGQLASASKNGETITLSKKYYGSVKSFQNAMDSAEKEQITVTGVKSVIDHEFAHLILNHIKVLGVKQLDTLLRSAWFTAKQEFMFGKKIIISRYAISNYEEFFAETFSLLRKEGAKNYYTKEIEKVIEQYKSLTA